MMAGAALVDFIQHGVIWTSYLSRRFILTPGMMLALYVAFFDDHPKALLGYSVLSPWVEYEYQASPAKVVGEWVGSGASMNANLFADGFANFGWFGMFGAAVVLLVYLRVLDRVCHGLPVAVSALVMVMPAITISNSSILTAMLSHGLVVAVALLALAPRVDWGKSPTSALPQKFSLYSAAPWVGRNLPPVLRSRQARLKS
jgi:hypothetical protein